MTILNCSELKKTISSIIKTLTNTHTKQTCYEKVYIKTQK
ncbi:protein of unknown function [Maridesulfovibrio hydrothermalis AM13 = DSM 14728]|uniref:Uncharacterized protein n=1 Tax=Maridesulfovibrio hydrothermalis AM13 = DSM 14728 TaxID=1121451 RepID=L0R9L3_9BACT|nr:protein of unknown function [Maridesulfovibrio hydrothermalis AM13 = DSM 14728]